MPSEIIPLGAGWYLDQCASTVSRGDLGTYGNERNGYANLLHSIVVKKLKEISGQTLGAHPSRVSPNYSIGSQHHPRSDFE
jgi:hypothetical protein